MPSRQDHCSRDNDHNEHDQHGDGDDDPETSGALLLPVGSTSRSLHGQNEQVASIVEEIFALLRGNVFEWFTSRSAQTVTLHTPASCMHKDNKECLCHAGTLLSPEPAP